MYFSLDIESAKQLRESLGLSVADEWSQITKGYRQGKERDQRENLKMFLHKLDKICPVYAELIQFIKEHEEEKIDDLLPRPGDYPPIPVPEEKESKDESIPTTYNPDF